MVNSLKLKRIIIDFEKAVIEACEEIFPEVQVQGCYFHWPQMVLKNLKFHGCYKLYKSSNDFRDLFKMLLSIPFLPLKRIITDYSLLKIIFKRKFSEDLDLHNFLMYFEKNFLYVNSKRGFHYDIWNVNNRIMMFTPITKKSAEAYNKSLGDEFANSHPSLVLFIQKLRCREFTYSD